MSSRTHQLTDTATGITYRLTLDGTGVSVETTKAGKSKNTPKSFVSPEEAAKFFVKKEWELLKKGAVLHQPDAKPGEALLHYYVGGGYTGCLSFAASPQGIFVYKNGDDGDSLLQLDHTGGLLETITLPALLPWEVVYNPATGKLLLDADHEIYEYDLKTRQFKNLIKKFDMPVSFVAVSQSVEAYGAHPQFVIRNLQQEMVVQQKFESEMVNGSLAFSARLSADGKRLAMHVQRGKIELLQTSGGNVVQTISGDFDLIEQMEFTHDGSVLLVREHYNNQRLLLLDVTSGQVIQHSGEFAEHIRKDVSAFCFNAAQDKLVLLKYNKAWVFDYRTKKLLHQFPVTHAVKTSNIRFAGEHLGVRTDYGCFSVYAL